MFKKFQHIKIANIMFEVDIFGLDFTQWRVMYGEVLRLFLEVKQTVFLFFKMSFDESLLYQNLPI